MKSRYLWTLVTLGQQWRPRRFAWWRRLREGSCWRRYRGCQPPVTGRKMFCLIVAKKWKIDDILYRLVSSIYYYHAEFAIPTTVHENSFLFVFLRIQHVVAFLTKTDADESCQGNCRKEIQKMSATAKTRSWPHQLSILLLIPIPIKNPTHYCRPHTISKHIYAAHNTVSNQ